MMPISSAAQNLGTALGTGIGGLVLLISNHRVFWTHARELVNIRVVDPSVHSIQELGKDLKKLSLEL
jgi:hypothetical protein